MRLSEADVEAADAGAQLLQLACCLQSMPVGPAMADAIRRTCLSLPGVGDVDVELLPSMATRAATEVAWTHHYDIGPGPESAGVVRLRVSDVAGFAGVDRLLRDALLLIGNGIVLRRTRERLEAGNLGGTRDPDQAADHVENARLAEIVRRSVNPTYVMDLDYRLVWMNQPFLDTFGLTWADAIGRYPSALLYPDREATVLIEEVRAALSERGAYFGEVTNRDRHGVERVFALRMDCFKSADGHHQGYVAIREDVTERRRAERALAESEARFRDLTETASDWFWETDAEHRFLKLTEAWRVPPGMGHEIAGRRRWDVAVGDLHGPSWQRHFDDLDQRRPFRDFRYTVQWPTGDIAHVSISGRPVFDHAGAFAGYRGTGRDLTEEVRARETVDRLIRALDGVEDLVALFDADERLVFANRLFKDLHPAIETILVPGTTMSRILEALAECGVIEDPERAIPARLETFRRPTGLMEIRRFGRWFRTRDQKLEDGGTLVIAADVTNTKEVELELRQAVDAAEEANAAKSAFLARMSHELRTPLNAILGLSETLILLEATVSPNKRREYLGDILQAGRILLSHIDDILNFTRLDAGGFEVHTRPLDARRAVAEAVRLMRVVARSRAIRLEADLPRDLPRALADPRSVRQILVNLLSNAVKFSGHGAVVRVEVAQDSGRLRLSVLDRGIGIAVDQIDRIFEPFHQVGNPSVAAREGGTGLGLSIVRALVDRNNGSIRVDSVQGVGTTISVWLPLAPDEVPD